MHYNDTLMTYFSSINSISNFGMSPNHVPSNVGPPPSMMSSSTTPCLQQRDSYSCMSRGPPTYESLGMSPYSPLKPPTSSCSPMSHNTYHNMNGHHQYNGTSGKSFSFATNPNYIRHRLLARR